MDGIDKDSSVVSHMKKHTGILFHHPYNSPYIEWSKHQKIDNLYLLIR